MLTLLKGGSAAGAAGEPWSDDLAPLVRGAVEGDPAAVRRLIGALGPALLRCVRRVLGADHADLEDVMQEAVFALVTALPRFRGESSTVHFACRVAALTAISARRRAGYRQNVTPAFDPGELDTVPGRAPSPLADLVAEKRRRALMGLLGDLPDPQAEVLVLHYVLGYTVDQIAGSSSIPRDTVRSRLRAAKRALLHRAAIDPVLAELVGPEELP